MAHPPFLSGEAGFPSAEYLLENLGLGITVIDRDGVVRARYGSDPSGGWEVGEMLDAPEILAARESGIRQCSVENRDGKPHRRWFVPARNAAGDVEWVISYSESMGEDGAVLDALRSSEERYRLLFEGSRDAIAVYGQGLRPVLCNSHFAELTGYTLEEIGGIDPMEAVHPDDREKIIANHNSRLQGLPTPRIYEFRLIRKDGKVVPIEVSFDLIKDGETIVGIQGIFRDISERKKLFEHLLEKQKEKSIVTLAGGIAHDFNNILLGVLGNAGLLEEELSDRPDAVELLRTIQKSAGRMADLTNQLLAFARGGRHRPERLDVNQTLTEGIRSLAGTLGPGAILTTRLDPEAWHAKADRMQISQVFLNLFMNALEAMPDGGALSVTTRNRTQEMETTLGYSQTLRAGDYVVVEVEDTGSGMNAETLDRLFEPFYTTKFLGRGLGLAAAVGIVRSHGGVIEVESEEGRGSCFRVFLPRSI